MTSRLPYTSFQSYTADRMTRIYTMDVANSKHLDTKREANYFSDDDVTAEGVDFMRKRAAPSIEGRDWIRVDSVRQPVKGSR